MIARHALFLCIAGAAFALSASIGRAATVTFDGLPTYLTQGETWVEDGVTVVAGDGGDIGAHWVADAAHLDDSGTSYTSRLEFLMAVPFIPIEFRIFGMETSYRPEEDCLDITCPYLPYENLLVRTFRHGMLTYEQRLYAGDPGEIWTYTFPDLEAVDLLSIASVLPAIDSGNGAICISAPCGHFSIDNVTLAPIPLPSTAPLLLVAGGLMLLARRRRL
jgi:hypothetical protein